jgi:hypothetical protein
LNWLPVDEAAQAIVGVCFDAPISETSVQLYNVINPDEAVKWESLLIWIERLAPGLKTVSPQLWLFQLKRLHEDGVRHPAMKLLDLWRDLVSLVLTFIAQLIRS